MITHIGVVTILVRDQNEALQFYTEKLGFEPLDDIEIPGYGRWLTLRAAMQPDVMLSLYRADEADAALVGRNAMWSLRTDDCRADYESFRAKGVTFFQQPTERPWGIEALFEDLYGNKFSLLQPSPEGM